MKLNLIAKRGTHLILLVLCSEMFFMTQSYTKGGAWLFIFAVACSATYLLINAPPRKVDLGEIFGERAEYIERVLRDSDDKVDRLCASSVDRNAATDRRSTCSCYGCSLRLQPAGRVTSNQVEAADPF